MYHGLSLDRHCLYNLFVFVQHMFLEHGVRDKPLSTDSARMGHQFDHPVRLGFVLTNTVVLKRISHVVASICTCGVIVLLVVISKQEKCGLLG